MTRFNARATARAICALAPIALWSGAAMAQTVLSDLKVPVPSSGAAASTDRFVQRAPGEPTHPDTNTWGYDVKTGAWRHPAATPFVPGPYPSSGSLDFLDQNQYALNTKAEAYHPHVVTTNHSWQTIFDFDDRRYMYHYYRTAYKIYDITDPRDLKVVADKKLNTRAGDRAFGPMAVRFSNSLNKLIAVQCYEVPRFGLINNKYLEPEKVKTVREMPMLRGFAIYEVTSPQFDQWKLLSETTLDPEKDAKQQPQQGSGCIDVPYFNEKHLFVAGAPDDSFANTEYTSVLWSGAQLAYDISDPAKPKKLSTWWVPGQRLGEEAEYAKNPRYGNRASWLGARMPTAIPKPPEEGGKYGYAPMGGLGMHVIDISDPARLRSVGKVETPVSIGGTEGDNVDVTKAEKTGVVYFSGYPLNDDCYEPYKDVYAIDVKDPANPKVIATLPRPTPPKEAPFTDYCQRRGSFGPKRTGYWTNPGTPSDKYLIYAFYNAGMQMFDVSDPANPKIAAYFVPKMVEPKINLDYSDPTHSVFIEWDRNLVWVITNHGLYAVSSPLLGAPVLGMAAK
ncbi:MAG: hypothetical protein KME20_28540 [Kaiparowitsia implicata GSE-PSE-MK54-09C]|jgi:hypothetical protein|nr:hypothetical protein [Kaiparowitsia implicata GSE-PSE-MK54-09C]